MYQQYSKWLACLRTAHRDAFGVGRLRNILIISAVLMTPLLLLRVTNPTYSIALEKYFAGAVCVSGLVLVFSTVLGLLLPPAIRLFNCLFVLSLDSLTLSFVLLLLSQ
jgi:hypothetical protein